MGQKAPACKRARRVSRGQSELRDSTFHYGCYYRAGQCRCGVGEIDSIVVTLARFDMFIFFEKCPLLTRVLFAGNMRGLLVGKSEAMQRISDSTD